MTVSGAFRVVYRWFLTFAVFWKHSGRIYLHISGRYLTSLVRNILWESFNPVSWWFLTQGKSQIGAILMLKKQGEFIAKPGGGVLLGGLMLGIGLISICQSASKTAARREPWELGLSCMIWLHDCDRRFWTAAKGAAGEKIHYSTVFCWFCNRKHDFRTIKPLKNRLRRWQIYFLILARARRARL